MKLLKVGVYHHNCWGSFSTKNRNISMAEQGTVKIVKKTGKGVLVDSFFKISADNQNELLSYLNYLQKLQSIKKLKICYQNQNEAYAFIQFLSKTSSYDAVLKTHAIPIGSIVQEKELEIHTVLTEKPGQTKRLLDGLEQLGEVKILRSSDFSGEQSFPGLTKKQHAALLQALHNNYYSWPRKATLEKLAEKSGMKRRNFQEHLRLAEAKIIPYAIEKAIKKAI